MRNKSVPFNELANWLERTPVIGNVHPLVPLCLKPETRLIADSQELLKRLDNPSPEEIEPILIIDQNSLLVARFPQLNSLEHPPIEAINLNMGYNLAYARKHLLTTHKVAAYIENDVTYHHPDVVVLFLVDGLSYGDTQEWKCELQPCFIDGPSVTYRFHQEAVVPEVGFASIINRPSIYHRLYQLGYHHARGYTYWDRNSNNAVANFMFEGLPCKQVTNFSRILDLLEEEKTLHTSYIQIVREGLDGLAHGKRELSFTEIDAASRAIFQDIEKLLKLLSQKKLRTALYVTADHGILWKNEHAFPIIQQNRECKPRYSLKLPEDQLAEYTIEIKNSGISYYLFRYPYLGNTIRSNDSGIHGGLSYQESIVPFAKFKV